MTATATLDLTEINLDLSQSLKCQYGQQNILDDAKCLLDCTHDAHAPEPTCQQPAAWMELLKCHGEQALYCENHAAAIKERIDLSMREAAKDGENLECFHCDVLFDYQFVRV